jgi:hypothetical protein
VHIDLSALPDDAATLQLMLRTVVFQQGELAAENDKLRLLIQRLTRHQFGRRSEQLTPDQLQLALEELEQTIAANQAGQDAAADAAGLTRKPRAEAPARNHGALPAHLPRYEIVVDCQSASKKDPLSACNRDPPFNEFDRGCGLSRSRRRRGRPQPRSALFTPCF